MPERIQRGRRKGDRLPPGAVVVSRPTRWGNNFAVVQRGKRLWQVVDRGDRSRSLREEPMLFDDVGLARGFAVRTFELNSLPIGLYPLDLNEVVEKLGGRDLACWCRPEWRCHGDVLLVLANPSLALAG